MAELNIRSGAWPGLCLSPLSPLLTPTFCFYRCSNSCLPSLPTTSRSTSECCRRHTPSSGGQSPPLSPIPLDPPRARPLTLPSSPSCHHRWKSQFKSDRLYSEILLVLSQFCGPYFELFKVRPLPLVRADVTNLGLTDILSLRLMFHSIANRPASLPPYFPTPSYRDSPSTRADAAAAAPAVLRPQRPGPARVLRGQHGSLLRQPRGGRPWTARKVPSMGPGGAPRRRESF